MPESSSASAAAGAWAASADGSAVASETGVSVAWASGLTSLTSPPQPVAGWLSTAHTRPFSARTVATAARTSAPVALVSTTAHLPAGAGGSAPSSVSAARP